jgi:hypothetical protein
VLEVNIRPCINNLDRRLDKAEFEAFGMDWFTVLLTRQISPGYFFAFGRIFNVEVFYAAQRP